MVIMTCAAGMGDAALRDLLPRLWRRIEDAHYSYLETDDSPEKLQQKKKLEDYIMEYLARAPHECKFRLAETNKVFQRTVNELVDFNAHRAGVGWAAVARYAGNLLTQPWRKEYRVIRLYSGFYKHEVEANMVGAERLLHAMGYSPAGAGRLALVQPVCPDTAAAVSRDALVAHCECRIMLQIWETIVSSGANVTVSWGDIYRARAARPDRPAATAARLIAARGDMPYIDTGSEIYSNIPTTVTDTHCRVDPRYHNYQPIPSHHQYISPNHQTMPPNHEPIPPNHQPTNQCHYCPEDIEDPMPNIMHPQYMMPQNMVPQYMYSMPHPEMPQCSNMMTQYLPYYYPVQAPYMIPTPVYPSIKQAATVPVNGYPPYRYPTVPTAQLIELESASVYENNNHKKLESSRRNSTSKSGFSDVTLPSLPRSDTQPVLSKAREDGMGTYESWDYVFRNLSNKEDDDTRNRYSPSLDRDSRTLDRLDKAHKSRYQPTTLDLEDGLQALSLDHRVEELKKDLKKSKQTPKRLPVEEKKAKRPEPVGNPAADGLITSRITPDKIKLLTKKEIKDRKEVVKQQNSVNGNSNLVARVELKKAKKPAKSVSVEIEKPRRPRPSENGTQSTAHTSKSSSASSVQPNFDLKAQLVVSLDEADSRSPPRSNGDRPHSRNSTHETTKWECATCTYINKNNASACEMCGKSKMGPEIQPLTSGGKECPACTLVNQRDAKICDACGTNLEHCPTYI